MILCDRDIRSLLTQLIPNEDERDDALINPASLDIRIGRSLIRPDSIDAGTLTMRDGDSFFLMPGEFVLVSTYERIRIPNGYAADLRLKSSSARAGFQHSLAFWVDPGWDGVLTMEVQNVMQFRALTLTVGQRFAQLLVHRLTGDAERPYAGRYNGAVDVEGVKR